MYVTILDLNKHRCQFLNVFFASPSTTILCFTTRKRCTVHTRTVRNYAHSTLTCYVILETGQMYEYVFNATVITCPDNIIYCVES
jgi:hypothetical protein